MSAISFIVPGTPVGKGRPRFAKRGNFVKVYTPEATASYENLVKIIALNAMKKGGHLVLQAAVSMSMEIYVTPPASWSAKKRNSAFLGEIFPTVKPDLDNIIKGVLDALNGVVWNDDKQVIRLEVFKRYAQEARAVVLIEEVVFAAAVH